MKKIYKLIGLAVLLGLIPYRFTIEKDTHSYELASILWALKKTVDKDSSTYTIDLLPFINFEAASEEYEEDGEEQTA